MIGLYLEPNGNYEKCNPKKTKNAHKNVDLKTNPLIKFGNLSETLIY